MFAVCIHLVCALLHLQHCARTRIGRHNHCSSVCMCNCCLCCVCVCVREFDTDSALQIGYLKQQRRQGWTSNGCLDKKRNSRDFEHAFNVNTLLIACAMCIDDDDDDDVCVVSMFCALHATELHFLLQLELNCNCICWLLVFILFFHCFSASPDRQWPVFHAIHSLSNAIK